jgi:hypothetical protein
MRFSRRWVRRRRAIALMMEAARTSETLVNFYQTTRRYNPEDSHLLRFLMYLFVCNTSINTRFRQNMALLHEPITWRTLILNERFMALQQVTNTLKTDEWFCAVCKLTGYWSKKLSGTGVIDGSEAVCCEFIVYEWHVGYMYNYCTDSKQYSG